MKRIAYFSGMIGLAVLIALLISITAPSKAQDIARNIGFDRNLKIAYVSNQDGDEDIYVIPWNGWAGWTGESTPLNRTQNDQGARDWDPVWSRDGSQIAFTSDRNDGLSQIYIVNEDGSRTHPLFETSTSNDLSPSYSPDGQQIVFVSDRAGRGWDLYLADTANTQVTQLTTTGTIKGDPVFTPDGTGITYWERQIDGTIHLFRMNLTNPGNIQRLSFNGRNNGMGFWSPDASTFYYESDRNEGKFQVFTADSSGNNPRPLTEQGVNSGRADVSPDGSLIIFTSDRFDSDELFIMNADGTALEQITSNNWSDHSPAWQPLVPPRTQDVVIIAEPTPIPVAPEADEQTAELSSLGQSVNNVTTFPISLETLKSEYGIEAWQQAGWRGQSMKIGVIDLGFGGMLEFQERTGTEVQLRNIDNPQDYSNDGNTHGRHVLEIIHEIAPDATLFACRYDGSLDGLIDCKNYLAIEQQVDVINHSAGIPVLPLNGNNEWASTARDATNNEVIWVNSSGNFQQSFYSRVFDDRDGDNMHDFTVEAGVSVDELQFRIAEPYTGNVILTWEETGGRSDFNLEIVDAQTGSMIRQSQVDQMRDFELPPSESILLTNQSQPFSVRIRYVDGARDAKLALVVEYLPINLGSATSDVFQRNSSIAPSDERNVLTVGAVRTVPEEASSDGSLHIDQLAPYSSFGLLDSQEINPDITAYGELIMPDNVQFFGTSAAAPVVAGAIALYKEAYSTRFASDLQHNFLSEAVYQPTEYSQASYGAGVLRMPIAPSRIGGDNTVTILPKIIFPQPAEVVTETAEVRCGRLNTRLASGVDGYVSYELGLGFRTGPGENYNDISFGRSLQLGERFIVVEGPQCGNGASWWNVELEDGSTGWVSEGQTYYLITPSSFARAQLPETYSLDCPNAPEPLLAIGERAVIDDAPAGGLTMWNYFDRFDVIGTMGEGVELQVLGGPHCEESIATRLWYVRVLSGRWEGAQGWISEARPSERWIVPIS